MNPHPEPGARRITGVAGATRRDDARTALIESAEWFDLTRDQGAAIVASVWAAARSWREVAARHGLGNAELTRFAAVLDDPAV